MDRDEGTTISRVNTILQLKKLIDDDLFHEHGYVRIDDASVVRFTETESLDTELFTEFLEVLNTKKNVSSLVILFCLYRYYLWTTNDRVRIDESRRSVLLARGFALCLKSYFAHCVVDDDKDNNILMKLETRLLIYYGIRWTYSRKPLSSWPVPLHFLHEDFFELYDAIGIVDFIDYVLPCITENEDFYTTIVFRDMNMTLLHVVDRYVLFHLIMRWLCDFEKLTVEGRFKLIEAFKESMDYQEFVIAIPFSLFTPKRVIEDKCNYLYENVTDLWLPEISRRSYEFIKRRADSTSYTCTTLSSRLPTLERFKDGEEIGVKCISFILGVLPYDMLFELELFDKEKFQLNLLSQDESTVVKKVNLDSSMYVYDKFIDSYARNSHAEPKNKADATYDFSRDIKCIACEKIAMAEITFVQCGHTNCCASCAYSRSKCPACDSFITFRVKAERFQETFHKIQRSMLLGVAETFDRHFDEIRNILLPYTHMYNFRNGRIAIDNRD